MFTLDTLIEATGNFHEDNKLGEGGFGTVYKVCMHKLYRVCNLCRNVEVSNDVFILGFRV